MKGDTGETRCDSGGLSKPLECVLSRLPAACEGVDHHCRSVRVLCSLVLENQCSQVRDHGGIVPGLLERQIVGAFFKVTIQ